MKALKVILGLKVDDYSRFDFKQDIITMVVSLVAATIIVGVVMMMFVNGIVLEI